MLSLKQLRRRLRTVHNTKLITRAMRSVSASKMRKAQDRRSKAKPYADHLEALVARLVSAAGMEGQPLAAVRPVHKRLVVLFASDRGLCGAYNNSICRFGEEFLRLENRAETDLYLIGRRANDFFRKRGYSIAKAHTDFRGNMDTPRVLEIARELHDAFCAGTYDEILMIHHIAISGIVYRPKKEVLLPLKAEELLRKAEVMKTHFKVDYLFEPDAVTVLAGVLPKYVETKVIYSFLDTLSAEHQARMLAMTTANNNCEELIGTLTLQINKARQSQITKELLEIVSGADALAG